MSATQKSTIDFPVVTPKTDVLRAESRAVNQPDCISHSSKNGRYPEDYQRNGTHYPRGGQRNHKLIERYHDMDRTRNRNQGIGGERRRSPVQKHSLSRGGCSSLPISQVANEQPSAIFDGGSDKNAKYLASIRRNRTQFQDYGSSNCNASDQGAQNTNQTLSSVAQTQITDGNVMPLDQYGLRIDETERVLPTSTIGSHVSHRMGEVGQTNVLSNAEYQQIKNRTRAAILGHKLDSQCSKRFSQLTHEEKLLPLAAPKVSAMDIDLLLSRHPDNELHRRLTWLYEGELQEGDIPQNPHEDMPQTHFRQFIEAGYLTKLHASPLGYATYRVKVERTKKKLRPIGWPKEGNITAKATQEQTSNIGDAIPFQRIPIGSWAVAFDMKCSFYQLRLRQQQQRYFSIFLYGEWYTWSVALMGFTRSPDTLHDILAAVVKETVETAATEGILTCIAHSFIDNCRFILQSKSQANRVKSIFTMWCLFYEITLNCDQDNAPHQIGTYLGIHYDYQNAMRKNSQNFLQKVSQLHRTIEAETVSLRDFQSMVGVLTHGSRVIQDPLSSNYYVYKQLIHMTNSVQTRFVLWRRTIVQLNEWIQRILRNDPVSIDNNGELSSDFMVIHVDASTTGWGIIVFGHKGQIIAFEQSTWKFPITASEINFAEMKAVALGMIQVKAHVVGCKRIIICTDNQCTELCLRSGRSSSFRMNVELNRVLMTLRTHFPHSKFFTIHVPTEQNRADQLSRGTTRMDSTVLLSNVAQTNTQCSPVYGYY